MATLAPIDQTALSTISAAVGAAALVTDEAELRYYSQDVYSNGPTVLAVFRPADKAMLARGIAAATAAGVMIVPRGGGMSYTGGYLAPAAGALLIDTGSMNRVLDINAEDMTVTVEAGCTWDKLHRTLKPHGLRALAWGTLSGINATVGGGMSQNGVFWGAGGGTVVDAALSFEVVLADGTMVSTGSSFFRPFGPDVTGIFAADCGAFGVKATVTLKLVREGTAFAYGSFSFPDAAAFFGAMSAVARDGLASESFGFDPYLQAQRMKRESLTKDAKSLVNMMKAQGSAWKALKEGAKVVAAGRSFLDDVPFSLHLICEGRHQSAVEADMKAIEAIAARHGGKAIENTIPKILRANPFPPVNSMVGPDGERWVPVHGFLPHSRLVEGWNRIQELFDANRAEMEANGVAAGAMLAAVSRSTCLIEPVFFWPDALEDIHCRSLEADHLAKLNRFPANAQSRALVGRLRAEIVAIFRDLEATHLQVARTYPLAAASDPRAWDMLKALKALVDPRGLMNPGSLGL
ncbi:FAD linked oxidase domain-containing protein [Sphingomonas sp. MM-1]|uniref:FAD-binding oxidoreductase n=1 Tax=Sphingomonas sp. MM-1 TaxID=745310 RepID=UPI0002C0A3DF|nr:FAD-binding oxidoreductase [Sphingomonas sp. MM-1]AGH47821.1 FAD linked oxidase domain-containing protein [Sphingomonas sp. MM-1]